MYLSIFLVTLIVRLLFFAPDVPREQNAYQANSRFKTYHLMRYGYKHVHFSPSTALENQNGTTFGHRHELTAN